MLDALFTWLTEALSGRFDLALAAAFGWGLASVILSPCHLSSIPLVIGYISSRSREEKLHPVLLSALFAIGILISIGAIGLLTAGLGRMLGDVGMWGNLIVALVFFVVGLYLMDVVRLNWNPINPRASLAQGRLGALLLGVLFGIGLGPCTFAYLAPILGIVFGYASANIMQALGLFAAFGAGHCSVIVVAGTAAGFVQRYLNWTEQSKGLMYTKRIAGGLVILGGVYFLASIF